MPKKVAMRITQIQRRFLWKGEMSYHYCPLVKWSLVQRPKQQGGLGVGDLQIQKFKPIM